MSTPIPTLEPDSAQRTLSQLYLNLTRSQPGEAPALLVTLPPAWANKYQILLYSAAARHRFAVAGAVKPEVLDHVHWPGPITLHAHWFAPVFHGAASPREATTRLEAMKDDLLRFRDRTGARLIWTAHNVFPHGNAHPDAFLALRQWTLEEFDAVHVMDAAHVPLLENAYGRKISQSFSVPHMLYTGAQPNIVDRAAARAHFGLPTDSVVFGAFGSIQAYKQIHLIIESLDQLTPGTSAHALIGGLPVDSKALRMLQAVIGRRRDVTLLARNIDDHEIQHLHKASDVMVLPYAESLNSGAAMMAATFRTPFLMPEGPVARTLAPLGAVPFAQGCLAQAMQRAADTKEAPQIDPATWESHQPHLVSEAFFQALTKL